MKKALAILLLFAVLLTSCGKNTPDEQQQTPEAGNKKAVTLMVYMVGSDLEAKGGAGSDDLEEMAESGVDLSQVNVLVYAGGSKKWHNDTVSAEDGHTVLSLGEDGFSAVASYEERSMGEPAPLSDFLNYSYENYPAEDYALVLWDHGDGPLIGYGKDMLYDNDSLTLSEMREAFSSSPFKGENKLSWVGFDACLMSSAELALVLCDYSERLVASQEIEPAFGWNYSFLSELGKTETSELLRGICEGYLTECEKYYERRGFEGRDTTLAAMDLSAAGELESSLEALFSAAASDVSRDYNTLAARRVECRALGRASTGSEYDLVDLYDLAEKMSARYPDEAGALMSAVKKLVTVNSTNAEGLCGVSLYYPFYNKSYYEKSWGEVYRELGVLSDYGKYLDGYTQIWLGGEFLEESAASAEPEAGGENEYVLTLTDEQAETYADASYYILYREGDELYTAVYVSGAVEKDKNKLIANFDGNVLYAKNDLGQYMLPVAQERDTVGDSTRYVVNVGLTNETSLILDKPEGYTNKSASFRFHISANEKTKEISTSALVPYDESVSADELAGGKVEDADISEYSMYYFLQQPHRYLERYENGVVKPVSRWTASSYYSAYTSRTGDGLEFTFAPLPEGEFYLIFEIQDTQGSKYCSEVIPVTSEMTTPTNPAIPYTDVKWESGEKVKLGEKENVEFYLTTVESYSGKEYTLEVKNNNGFKIAVLGTSVAVNGNVLCHDGSFGYFSVGAGEAVTDPYGISFGDAVDAELIDSISSIQLELKVTTYLNDKTVVPTVGFNVELSDETAFVPRPDFFSEGYYVNTDAVRDVLAKKQKLFSEDGLELTLIGFGGEADSDSKLVLTVCLENKSDEEKHVCFDGMSFDGIFVELGSGPISLPAGMKLYRAFVLDSDELDMHGVTSPSEVSLTLHRMQFATLEGGGGFSQVKRCELKLAEKGEGCILAEGELELLDCNGVKITLRETVVDGEDTSTPFHWICTVENNSGEGITLSSCNVKINGKSVANTYDYPLSFQYGQCGDGESTVLEIYCWDIDESSVEITFDFEVYDFNSEKLLWSCGASAPITAEY